jgi:hypothetical protein
MSGPVASVLLRRQLTDSDHAVLLDAIKTVSDQKMDKPPVPDGFWVRNTRPIGGDYFGDGRPFAFSTGLQQDWEAE